MKRIHVLSIPMALSLCLSVVPLNPAQAGAYIFAGDANGIDLVAHPTGYSGGGGTVTSKVCIVPGSTNAAALEIPVQNTVDRFNQFTAIVDNLRTGGNNDIPSGAIDIESALIHEVGHCIGLAHPNAASESGLGGADTNYTKVEEGPNNVFDLGIGADGIRGSADDVRGDDVNLHWFLTASNNPFEAPTDAIDQSNFSRQLASLPAGDLFAANADRTVSGLYGIPTTEAAMQQGQGTDEDQRGLVGDDINSLRFARAGSNRIAGDGDDYQVNMIYGGISNAGDCTVTVALDTSTGFAVCRTGGTFIGSSNIAITTADVRYNENTNWFFTSKRIPSPQSDALSVTVGGTISVLDGGSNSLLANDSHPNGLPLTMTSTSFSGPDNGNVSLNANGTFSYTHDGGPSLSDRFVYQVCVNDAGATRTCSYAAVLVSVDPFDDQLIFADGFEGN